MDYSTGDVFSIPRKDKRGLPVASPHSVLVRESDGQEFRLEGGVLKEILTFKPENRHG